MLPKEFKEHGKSIWSRKKNTMRWKYKRHGESIDWDFKFIERKSTSLEKFFLVQR